MGFFVKGPEDAFANMYIKFTPGATKAGGRAKYFGMVSFARHLNDYRRKKSMEEYPTATKEQIDFACKSLGAKEGELLDAIGHQAKLKEWQSENQKLETMFWEDVANGKIPEGTLSPEQLFDMSFWDAVRVPKTHPQAEQGVSVSGSQEVDSRVVDASTSIDGGSQKTPEGASPSTVNNAEIIKTTQSYSSQPPSQEKSFSSGDESIAAAIKSPLNNRTSLDNQRIVKYVVGGLIIVATTFGGWRYMSGPSVIKDVRNLSMNDFEALNQRGQKYNSDLEALSNLYSDWMLKNAKFFLAHSPLSADEITREQTKDLTIVTSQHKTEILNIINYRKEFLEQQRNLLKKYQPLAISTVKISEAGIRFDKDTIENYQLLADGKISFGEFNLKRFRISQQIDAELNMVLQEYKIK